MPTFKVGDRVRVSNATRPYAGEEGTVITLMGTSVEVVLDEPPVESVLYQDWELELLPAVPQEERAK